MLNWIQIWAIFFCILILIKQGKLSSKVGIFILILLSVLRWDIGNDYYNYILSTQHSVLVYKEYGFRKGFQLLNKGTEIGKTIFEYIFYDFPDPVIWIIGSLSIITIFFWYVTLKKYNCLFWGFFVILFYGILFNSWDQVRQGVAISIFLYSIYFIESKQIIKYLLFGILAFLFHTSAIIIFPLYFITRIRLKIWVILLLVSIFLFGYISKLWLELLSPIFNAISIYERYVSQTQGQEDIVSATGTIIKTIIYTTLIIFIYRKYTVIGNILLFGIILYLFSCTNPLIIRVANYGLFSICLGLPLFFKIYYKNKKFRLIGLGLATLIFITGTKNAIRGESGCIPYISIFSSNYEKKIIHARPYWD